MNKRIYTDRSFEEIFSLKNLLILIALLFSIAMSFLLLDFTVSHVPDQIERDLFKSFNFKESRSKNSPHLEALLKKLLDKNPDLRKLNYQIIIKESDLENACAVPGGSIIVTSKLVENNYPEIALAFILSHELAHHHLRHCFRGFSRKILGNIVERIINPQSNSVLGTTNLLIFKSSQRSWERDADLLGLKILENTYENLNGFDEFFRRQTDNGVNNEFLKSINGYFSSHPSSEERILYLREYLKSKNHF